MENTEPQQIENIEVAEVSEATAAIEPPKRKRGRPAIIRTEEELADKVPKRKRGRPAIIRTEEELAAKAQKRPIGRPVILFTKEDKKEAKKKYNQKYTSSNPLKIKEIHKRRTFCETCNLELNKYTLKRHLRSLTHLYKNKEIPLKVNVVE